MSDEILKELGEIKSLLHSHIVKSDETQKHQDEKIYQHSVELWGNNGNPGIKTHVDRLNTVAATFKWIFGTIIALVGERIWSIFKN